ncbi:hypothetical protein EYZ11_012503 [Aspergillus tanneri]|uniref:Uncharacterized protein n=1 Tax=Aspergillus tanneri TaxID=1220188 RepID=A0A4S3J031_9EURO|nr:hypothetical protein EYZ11_012503 [Aspergillus tanneri]
MMGVKIPEDYVLSVPVMLAEILQLLAQSLHCSAPRLIVHIIYKETRPGAFLAFVIPGSGVY